MVDAKSLRAPVLLLAMPQVVDPYFQRSVVLLVHHDDEGSLGLILNRPTEIRLTEILEGMKISWQGDPAKVAHFGGPVQPQLGSILFRTAADPANGSETTTEVLPGVSMTQHVGDLSRLALEPPAGFRLFLGYAGWGESQLLTEILRNDWLTAPVRTELLFATDDANVWEEALQSIGIDPATLPAWTSPGDEASAN